MADANDPRSAVGFDEVDAHFISIPLTGTSPGVTLPTQATLGYTASPDLGKAVTNVAVTTGAPAVGFGSTGNRLFGRLKQLELDGTATVQDRGYMLLPYVNDGTKPVPGTDVAVNGSGSVIVGSATLGSVCEGYVTDPATATLRCVVKKF